MSDLTPGALGRRVFLCALLGSLLCQAAWIIALPAFRGIDEFDHVYKAAAVARGELHTEEPAPHGRGGLVTIPGSIVAAASAACASRPYTGHDNCHPAAVEPGGLVRVATAAGAYNPVYYLVVGSLARPFSGAGVDYAMRAVTAFLCAALIAWAAALTARSSRGAWPLVGLAVAATPVLLYSTTLAGPNGLQYAGAVLVWTALLALAGDRSSSADVAALATGAVTVLLTHSTGPLWLALIASVFLVLRPWRHWWSVVRRHAAAIGGAVVIVAATAAFAVAWTHGADTNALGARQASLPSPGVGALVAQELFWMFQSVAAFPMRGEAAPMPVYAVWVSVFLLTLAALVLRSATRERLAGLLLVVWCVVVPGSLSVAAYAYQGWAWQGRYTLPLSVGLPLLAGWVLARHGVRARTLAVGVVVGVLAAAMTLSVVDMAVRESEHFGVRSVAEAVPGGLVLVVLLCVAGCLLPWWPARTAWQVSGTTRRRTTGAAGVSVLFVVPTLGRRRDLLAQALESVRAQDHPGLDLVVVAPVGSPAESTAGEIGARFLADPGRGGLPGALNAALEDAPASTRYFAWLGDDDLLTHGSLQATVAALDQDPDAVLVYGWCDYVDVHNHVVFRSRAGRLAKAIMRVGPNLIPQPGSLMRYDAVRAAGGLDESVHLAPDLDLYLRLRTRGRVLCVPRTLACFRWHPDSATVTHEALSMAEADRVRMKYLSRPAAAAYRLLHWPGHWLLRVAKRGVARNVARPSGGRSS